MNRKQPSINLVVLRSTDPSRAVTFYKLLGFTFTLHAHGNGPEHYSSEQNGFVFEIYPISNARYSTTSTRIGFEVPDVDLSFELLIQLGAEHVSQPTDSEWGRRAVVKDLDGHTVELLTPNCS